MKTIFATILTLALAAIPAAAKQTLTVYTYDSFVSEWGPGAQGSRRPSRRIATAASTGSRLGDGVAVLNRLKLEGAATKADVVLGLDTNLTAEAAATGLFGPHGLDRGPGEGARGMDRRVLHALRLRAFRGDLRQRDDEGPAASLDDLVNGDPAQKIILQDPRTSTPGLGFLLWMKAVYGDKAGEAWTKLSSRASSPPRPAGRRPMPSSPRARRRWCSPTRPRPPIT